MGKMERKYKVINENGEEITIICQEISDLPTAFSCKEDGEISEVFRIERIDFDDDD